MHVGLGLGLVLAGAGAVGRTLLALVERAFATQLTVVAIGDSRGVVTARSGSGAPLEWRHVRAVLAHKASTGRLASEATPDVTYAPTTLLQVVEALHAQRACKHVVVVDCTSSETTAPALARAKEFGFAVVMANKLPLSEMPLELYRAMVLDSDGSRSPLVQYEATVGAGLPVITTLKRMVASRDRILSVQGSFSGTIGYVLAAMNRCVRVRKRPSVCVPVHGCTQPQMQPHKCTVHTLTLTTLCDAFTEALHSVLRCVKHTRLGLRSQIRATTSRCERSLALVRLVCGHTRSQ